MKRINSVYLLILLLIMPLQAFAYLDPGAGSFILQMLIAGIMGGLFTMKLYWYKLKEWMNKLLGKEVASLDEDADIENGNDKIEK